MSTNPLIIGIPSTDEQLQTTPAPTKTITVPLWSYDDAPDYLKAKIIEKHGDINVDSDWWSFVYDEAERVGLEITEFDGCCRTTDIFTAPLGRHDIRGKLKMSVHESAKAIIVEHGKKCDTYKLAKKYVGTKDTDDDYDDVEEEYLHALLEEYLDILKREYENLTSEEGIIDTIKANGYLFDEWGSIKA